MTEASIESSGKEMRGETVKRGRIYETPLGYMYFFGVRGKKDVGGYIIDNMFKFGADVPDVLVCTTWGEVKTFFDLLSAESWVRDNVYGRVRK